MSKGETFLIRRAGGERAGELIRVPDELVLLASAPRQQAAEDVAIHATGRDLAFVLFRHFKKSMLFFAIVFGLAVAAAIVIPSSYRSESKLMVRLGVESMLPDPSVAIGKAVVSPIQNRNAEINTEVQILRSRELAEAVLSKIGPGRVFGAPLKPQPKVDSNDPAVRAAIMQIDRKLHLEVEPDSNVLTIAFESKDPDVSRDIVAAYVDNFRDVRSKIHRNPLTARFFGEQQESVRAEIDRLEGEIRKVRDVTGISDLDEQRKVLVARAGNIQDEIDKTNQLLVSARAGANHPGRARLIALKQQQNEVTEQFQRLNAVAVKLRDLERDFGIKSEVFKQYASIAQQAGVDSAMADNKLSNISVVQAASLPLSPSKPNRMLLIGVGLFLAVSGAIGLAFVAEAVDHTVKRPEDCALMGVSRAVSIPYIEELAKSDSGEASAPPVINTRAVVASAAAAEGVFSRRGGANSGTFAAGPWSAVDPTETTQVVATSGASDDIAPLPRRGGRGGPVVWLHELRQATRQLAEKLLINSAADGTSPRVIAFVGAKKSHGASTTACATATLLAERVLLDSPGLADSAVLLIDADLQSPSLHRQLGVSSSPGLTDWLADPTSAQSPIESVLQPACVEGLTVMPAGALRGGALTPSRLKRLIDVVAPNYQYVLIDLPPLDESPEAARLAAVCDGTILVMESDRVRKPVAIHTLNTLAEATAHLLGMVLNKRHYPVPDWVYRRL